VETHSRRGERGGSATPGHLWKFVVILRILKEGKTVVEKRGQKSFSRKVGKVKLAKIELDKGESRDVLSNKILKCAYHGRGISGEERQDAIESEFTALGKKKEIRGAGTISLGGEGRGHPPARRRSPGRGRTEHYREEKKRASSGKERKRRWGFACLGRLQERDPLQCGRLSFGLMGRGRRCDGKEAKHARAWKRAEGASRDEDSEKVR